LKNILRISLLPLIIFQSYSAVADEHQNSSSGKKYTFGDIGSAISKPFDYKSGNADSPISGSASASGASGEAPSLEKCQSPMGTMAVAEPQDFMSQALARYQLPPPNGLLRLMISQSNCFQIVERGMAMQNLMQERSLANSGQLQSGSNVGGGQLVTADFILTPEIAFSESNAGGAGAAVGALGSLFGAVGSVAGAVVGGMKFKEAQTTLLVADARSGIQVAAAAGSVSKADWGIGGFLGGVGVGAYTSSNEGKVVAAALLDNYNNIVKSIRSQPSLTQKSASSASAQNAASSVSSVPFNAGDVVRGKINNVKLYASPDSKTSVLLKLSKSDELIYLGDSENGFVLITNGNAEGWADVRFLTQ
jgi:hypothetical protein